MKLGCFKRWTGRCRKDSWEFSSNNRPRFCEHTVLVRKPSTVKYLFFRTVSKCIMLSCPTFYMKHPSWKHITHMLTENHKFFGKVCSHCPLVYPYIYSPVQEPWASLYSLGVCIKKVLSSWSVFRSLNRSPSATFLRRRQTQVMKHRFLLERRD